MNNIDIKEMEKELRKIFRDIEKSLKIQIILTDISRVGEWKREKPKSGMLKRE